jgi:thioredoxin:protein disulfide reductase
MSAARHPRAGRRARAAAALTAAAVILLLASAASATVTARWRLLAQPAGERGSTVLVLDVTVEPGWHVNAHDPDRPYLVPTVLTIEPPAGVRVAQIRYPEPVIRRLAFAGAAPLRLYEARFAIDVRLDGVQPETMPAFLRYQACNDTTCLPPASLPVALTLGGTAAPGRTAAGMDGALGGDGQLFERWMRDVGLLGTLALAVLFGLGLNLTPCVYPLISVTIAYFGGQRGASTRRVLLLASAYALGIALTFSVLGVVAALSGGLFGAALQRPPVLLAISVVLIALAASNFGLYQIRVPAGLTQRAGKASAGALGALAMGLTMGVVAAPCVGPIVVALLLFVAARQDALLGFALFFALAVGMGAPYVALAAVAGSLRRLPRSGAWLAWVERLFGFVLLGMALYFAAPVLGARVTAVAVPLMVASAGVYLGFIDRSGVTLPAFVVLKRGVGVVAIVAAGWLASAPRAAGTITWQPFAPSALSAARAAGKPAIVDFTARWCLPCRENDRHTFSDPEVGVEAQRFMMLRADVTEMTKEVEGWMEDYDVLGVPTIVIFGPDGRETQRVVGYVEPERLLALMHGRT